MAENTNTAQCQIKHYPIPKGSYRQLIYVDYNLSGDMRIQDGHFGALSWRIKQIIGLSRRNTKEGATKQARKGKGNTEHFVGASHIIRYYVFTCTVVMVAPTRRMPHATCHTAPSRLDQHFLYWLRKKAKK